MNNQSQPSFSHFTFLSRGPSLKVHHSQHLTSMTSTAGTVFHNCACTYSQTIAASSSTPMHRTHKTRMLVTP